MALSEVQRNRVNAAIMECASQAWQPLPNMSKQDLLDAVGDTDDYIDSIAGAFNAALPQPFRSEATAAQKAALFMTVASAQYLLDDIDGVDFMSCIMGKIREYIGQ